MFTGYYKTNFENDGCSKTPFLMVIVLVYRIKKYSFLIIRRSSSTNQTVLEVVQKHDWNAFFFEMNNSHSLDVGDISIYKKRRISVSHDVSIIILPLFVFVNHELFLFTFIPKSICINRHPGNFQEVFIYWFLCRISKLKIEKIQELVM